MSEPMKYDWRAVVLQHMTASGLTAELRGEVVQELAAHLEEGAVLVGAAPFLGRAEPETHLIQN